MKNRNQNFNDFYACLQREYLMANLRHEIYLKQKDKSYYLDREMAGKRKVIESISARNNIPSIFTDSWLMEKYKSEIYNEWGLPNFIYRSSEDRQNRRPRDIIAYFHKGVKVRVKTENSIKEGTIHWTNLEEQTVIVIIGSKHKTVPYSNLQRIFNHE